MVDLDESAGQQNDMVVYLLWQELLMEYRVIQIVLYFRFSPDW